MTSYLYKAIVWRFCRYWRRSIAGTLSDDTASRLSHALCLVSLVILTMRRNLCYISNVVIIIGTFDGERESIAIKTFSTARRYPLASVFYY